MTAVPLVPAEPARPGDRFGPYLVEDRLGEGGTAVVYRVRHRGRGSLHALKVIRVGSPRAIRRVVREAQLQATLRHPNVVRVDEVVRVGAIPGLVLEHVEGQPLEAVLRAFRPRPPQVDAIARDLLRGVAAAHARGLVHRDLTPANVLLGVERGRVVAKVGDFGLARALDPERAGALPPTRTDAVVGTPAYMSPEQFRTPREVDARADVFALGAILYELVSGARALRGDDLVAMHMCAARGDFVPLSERAPDAPPRWVEAVHRALAPRPEDRPPDAGALLALWTGGAPDPEVTWGADLLAVLAAPPAADEVSGTLASVPRAAPAATRWPVAWLVLAAVGLLGAALSCAALALILAGGG